MAPSIKDTGELTMTQQVGVILERIDELRTDMGEVKHELKCLSENYNAFQQTYARESVKLDGSMLSAHQRLDQHETRLLAVEKALPQLVMVARVLSVIGGLLLASVFGLLWAIVTHEITLVFPGGLP